MSQISSSKIITSPEAQQAQAQRINIALKERETQCLESIKAVLEQANCVINPSLTIDAMGVKAAGFDVIAKERLGMPKTPNVIH